MKLRVSGDKLTIASAHMLAKHDKCARIHGHNYFIEVEIEGELNEENMIIDFSEFKSRVNKIIKKYDHKVLIPFNSKNFNIGINDEQVTVSSCDGKVYRLPREDVEFLPLESTTVELLSKFIHNLIKEEYPQFTITVIMSETPTSVAIYTEDK